jgi:hypothetical protein
MLLNSALEKKGEGLVRLHPSWLIFLCNTIPPESQEKNESPMPRVCRRTRDGMKTSPSPRVGGEGQGEGSRLRIDVTDFRQLQSFQITHGSNLPRCLAQRQVIRNLAGMEPRETRCLFQHPAKTGSAEAVGSASRTPPESVSHPASSRRCPRDLARGRSIPDLPSQAPPGRS